MKPKLRLLFCLVALWAGVGRLMAQNLTTIQFSQSATPYNYQSIGGVPISLNVNPSTGSNGKLAATNALGVVSPVTTNQFASLVSFGGLTAPTNWMLLNSNALYLSGTNSFSGNVAQAMGLPIGYSNGTPFMVLQNVQLGAPYVSSPVSYNFGSIIPVPPTDVNGSVLTNGGSGYWQTVPYTAPGATNLPYYYSPNAGVVFATQPGQVPVTWITAQSFTTTPAGYVNPGGAIYPSFYTNGAYIYELYTATYLVSGIPSKTPQKMYWTEGSYAALSYPVPVSNGRVTSVHVVFNSSFPASVATPFPDPNATIAATNTLQTYTTLWYDSTLKELRAYNLTGRVFVELLGDPLPGSTTSQYLGYEIVDVSQSPSPAAVTVYLGNQLTPFQDGFENTSLSPWPLQNTLGTQYYYELSANGQQTYYADKYTPDQNDLQMYWLTTGVGGLQWPNLFVSYNLVWPADPSLYSHYLRPPVATQAQAAATAVQLNGAEGPSVDYQDPLDQPRAFLSSTYGFYTWLTPAEPAQRALLRFNAGSQVFFERVFSYLAGGLQDNALLAGSVITNLSAWNPTNSTLTNFASTYIPPYVTNLTVNVGDQITAPLGELGTGTNLVAGSDYWAGYVNTNLNTSLLASLNTNLGNSYDPAAYLNPFTAGIAAASRGAIIPVNAIPGANQLEVWWFRSDNANPALGFQPVYWPSVVGDYTIQWPANAAKIVLAGNAGSGPLDSLHAAGSIYYQNDPTQPGYNPNEEHALMLGGQAYALRDDLNITNTSNSAQPFGGYSSAPFVLLAYTGADGRPAMQPFQVQRENPAAGVFFDYVVAAGSQLQAPMPLPLMTPPVAVDTNYPSGITNYNNEPVYGAGDLPAGWNSAAASGPFSLYQKFTFQDRNQNFWVYRGLNAGLPALQAGYYNPTNNSFTNLPAANALLNQPFGSFIHVSRLLTSLTVGWTNSVTGLLPAGLALQVNVTNGLSVSGTPTSTGTYPLTITIADTDGSVVQVPFNLTVSSGGSVTNLGPLVITSTNVYTGSVNVYSNRPPSLAQAPAPTNCFTMRFYYQTQAGFAWPGYANPPAVGSVVPYLLPVTNGLFVGSPTNSGTPSLDIVYRPVWPGLVNGQPIPTLNVGQTLTTAVNGLAAVRGQDSVQVLYQQSIATNAVLTNAAASVVLFDPTVQKKTTLAALGGLPPSILTDTYNGLNFFPTLPPNLISRLWFDPNGTNLVLTGQFVTDPVNGNYVMLNILRGDDLAAVDALCPATPAATYQAWTNAVARLAVKEYTFGIGANPAIPAAYAINTNLTVTNFAGDLVQVNSSDTAVDSYALSAAGPGQGYISYVVANGSNPRYAGDPVQVYIAHVAPPLFPGALVVVNSANASPFSQLITFQHTADLAGNTSQYAYDWRIEPPVNGQPPALGSEPSWQPLIQSRGGPVYTLGAQGVQGMSDNYVSLRYGQILTTNNVTYTNWSPWANPVLAEGWITRVTQALDPVAGETQNLYQNAANTTASLIALAGARWNGNVPLNAASLTNNGLIQLYETVLNVGKGLSINAGINYGPANQALLTAAGYLNDLYTTLGNDAWANSLNPTIGFGTGNSTYGAIATSQFVFEGEEPTLLAQNLALLRGRDDSLSPGVDLPPVYNHLFWNYTYGIDAGQVIYALNYNITDQNGDGVVNAADAAIMYPQGHGDAYGHYLTAMMNYYELLMNPNFDWVPQAQTVLVLGAAVTVNYQNESKFAASAAALARTGRQIFDLEWRQDYQPGTAGGWSYFATNFVGQYTYLDNNQNTQHITRYWGMDHWASRVGEGAYVNWVVGNAILPPKDPNPNDQGVQIVDRTTVQDLQELPQTAAALENDMDNANAGFNPLGLAQNAIPFDINPQQVTGANPQTHFEQIYARAVQALNNAVVAFNAAQNVTQQLRQQQNSLSDLQAAVTAQELAYNDQLIELYGTPYPDDVGPGQTYPDGYTGPDLLHYMYVDSPATNTYGGILPDPTTNQTFYVDMQQLPSDWATNMYTDFNFLTPATAVNYDQSTNVIAFNIGPDGFAKPSAWTSERDSVGSIQTAAAAVNAAQDKLRQACADAVAAKQALDKSVAAFNAQNSLNSSNDVLNGEIGDTNSYIATLNSDYTIGDKADSIIEAVASAAKDDFNTDIPTEIIAGLADGGDFGKLALTIPDVLFDGINIAAQTADDVQFFTTQVLVGNAQTAVGNLQTLVGNNQSTAALQTAVLSLGQQLSAIQANLTTINQAQDALNGAKATYQTLLAQGNRLQQERLTFRQHTAAQVQGYTSTDAAFLIFQNENLERYTTLFNLAAQYAYLAANAYDYETGLLGTPAGRAFLNQIISSSALGVIQNGQPQVSGTSTGDPGLANALAEMYADWSVLKGRLGFNNPDGYGTTVSLRSENYRILSGAAGDNQWQELLQQSYVPDLLADTDVKNNCLQIDNGSGAAVPGIELTFSTTITDGENLFGQPLGPGDHSFTSSSFATKIFAVGVDLDGYVGMDNPVSNSGAGGTTPADPTLNPNGLSATPYVYLIPCGSDSMRSPPLGDTSTVRTWNVDDVAIPLPFNIGASDFSDAPFYQSSDSLSEPLFAVRKQQAFRPVSTLAAFNTGIYGATGALQPSQYTNQRLIGRSVWNSKWKLIIPGKTLLSDPGQGLARFINTVKDIHLYFVTYSYSGN